MIDASLVDAAHRGDTGPLGGPVLDAALVCPSIGHLLETWDAIDDDTWVELRDPSTSACTVSVADGRLELASADETVACGLVSASCYDLTDRAIAIDAVLPGDGVPEPFLRLELLSGGALEMRVTGGGPTTLELLRDGEPVGSVELDPEAHGLWRILHTEIAGRVDFQVAPHLTTDWTTIASTDVGSDETRTVQVIVGVSSAAAPVDAVAFDDLVGIDF